MDYGIENKLQVKITFDFVNFNFKNINNQGQLECQKY